MIPKISKRVLCFQTFWEMYVLPRFASCYIRITDAFSWILRPEKGLEGIPSFSYLIRQYAFGNFTSPWVLLRNYYYYSLQNPTIVHHCAHISPHQVADLNPSAKCCPDAIVFRKESPNPGKISNFFCSFALSKLRRRQEAFVHFQRTIELQNNQTKSVKKASAAELENLEIRSAGSPSQRFEYLKVSKGLLSQGSPKCKQKFLRDNHGFLKVHVFWGPVPPRICKMLPACKTLKSAATILHQTRKNKYFLAPTGV